MICGKVPGELFRYFDNIDSLIIIEKKTFSCHWFHIWFKIFFFLWDEVVDCRGSLLSLFLLTKKRYIHKKKKKRLHIVREISETLGRRTLHPHVSLDTKKLDNSILRLVLKKKKKNQFIMISPSANWIGKIWPQENFIQLLLKLVECRLWKNPIFIIVGKDDDPIKLDKLLNICEKKNLNLIGKCSLGEIFLIMKECKLFIGNDSGLMHLAAASSTPTIGLFGPSDSKTYGPWGEKTLSILSPDSPEKLMGASNFDPKKTGSLMNGLSVGKVFEETVKFYKSL